MSRTRGRQAAMSTSSFGHEHQHCTDDGNPIDTHRPLLPEMAVQALVVMAAGVILAVGASIEGAAMMILKAAMTISTAALTAAMTVVSHVPSARRSTAPFRGLPLPSERCLAVACYILICSPELDNNTRVVRVCASLVGEVIGNLSRSMIWGQEQPSIPAAENEPAQQEASLVPAAQTLRAWSGLLSNSAERPYEDEFSAKRFHASFRPLLALTSSIALSVIGIAAGDPALRPRVALLVPLGVAAMGLRLWLHMMQDQQRARLLFSRAVVALDAVRVAGATLMINTTNTRTTAATFLFIRVILAGLYLPLLAFCALPMGHRLTLASTIAAGAFLTPQRSDIGRPLEPIITCAAVLVGLLAGSSVDRLLHSVFPMDLTDDAHIEQTITGNVAHKAKCAATHFHASFRPLLASMSSIVLSVIGVAAGDPAFRPRAAMIAFLAVAVMGLRLWLHAVQDHERARLLFGRAVVTLNIVYTLGLILVTDSTNTRATAASFLFIRVILDSLLLQGLAYCALPTGHLLAVASTCAVGSSLLPQLSEIGRPLEPIITCAAVLIHLVLCVAIKYAMWYMFKEEEALKRERSEAQARADAAMEKHQALEAFSIAQRLADAEANRVADSQLNHMIKGLCGAAKTYNHLIEAGGFGPQCTSWAQYSIRVLNSAIQWAQSRQVLISLADGTFQTTRTSCHMESILREMLRDEDAVQVHSAQANTRMPLAPCGPHSTTGHC